MKDSFPQRKPMQGKQLGTLSWKILGSSKPPRARTKALDLAAFGLLEAAICLLLLGLLTSAGLKLYVGVQKMAQGRVTRAHQEQVATSLVAFVAREGYLPCPSQGGEAVSSQGQCLVLRGEIPYKTLGIAKNITLDGVGQPMGYVPQPPLTYAPGIGDDKLAHFCSLGGKSPLGQGGGAHLPLDAGGKTLTVLEEGVPVLEIEPGDYGGDTDMVAFALLSGGNAGFPMPSPLTVEASQGQTLYWISRDNLMMQYFKRSCHKAVLEDLSRVSTPQTEESPVEGPVANKEG